MNVPVSAQSNPAARTIIAKFVLEQARELGARIGTDGVSEIVMLAPCRVPTAMLRWLESQLHEYRWEVVAIINAGGRS